MGVPGSIADILEEVLRDDREPSQPSEGPEKQRWRKKGPLGRPHADFVINGIPILSLKWDDLGLGLVRSMGFVPSKAVQISFVKGVWKITGAYARSSLLLFLAAGGGGLIYFLRDLISQVQDWSWIGTLVVVVLPLVINMLVRPYTLEFQPYELEMLGYDAENNILVISTLTQPGGVMAIRVELPSDERRRKAEEQRIIESLRRAHTGFMRIDGLALYDMSSVRKWSIWALVWGVIIAVYLTYYRR